MRAAETKRRRGPKEAEASEASTTTTSLTLDVVDLESFSDLNKNNESDCPPSSTDEKTPPGTPVTSEVWVPLPFESGAPLLGGTGAMQPYGPMNAHVSNFERRMIHVLKELCGPYTHQELSGYVNLWFVSWVSKLNAFLSAKGAPPEGLVRVTDLFNVRKPETRITSSTWFISASPQAGIVFPPQLGSSLLGMPTTIDARREVHREVKTFLTLPRRATMRISSSNEGMVLETTKPFTDLMGYTADDFVRGLAWTHDGGLPYGADVLLALSEGEGQVLEYLKLLIAILALQGFPQVYPAIRTSNSWHDFTLLTKSNERLDKCLVLASVTERFSLERSSVEIVFTILRHAPTHRLAQSGVLTGFAPKVLPRTEIVRGVIRVPDQLGVMLNSDVEPRAEDHLAASVPPSEWMV